MLSLCMEKTCPKSKTCQRHTDSGAISIGFSQTWGCSNDVNNCKYFVSIEAKKTTETSNGQ